MKIGIDLLWVRVGICGGTESYIRNLLDGFAAYAPNHEYILFVSQDNAYSFQHYTHYPCMTLHTCKVKSSHQTLRILWENLFLQSRIRKSGLDLMFIPVYSKPLTRPGAVPHVTVIHDLQALHYPEYFSLPRRLFFRHAWTYSCRSSQRIICISQYGKQDLIDHFPFASGKVSVVYNPILSNPSGLDFVLLGEKYHIRKGEYDYCVSSTLPHKNLSTLLRLLQKQKKEGHLTTKLVISGVGANNPQLHRLLSDLEIEDFVVITGFVSNEERDCLYENCRLFLFPSVFEGFGMPPIEAMRKGKGVVMTRKSCLYEITDGKATYVDDPFSIEEWQDKIDHTLALPHPPLAFHQYDLEEITSRYIQVFESLMP